MDWGLSDKCPIENGSHKLTGSASIYTENIRSGKFPSKPNVASVTIKGLRSGYVQTSVS